MKVLIENGRPADAPIIAQIHTDSLIQSHTELIPTHLQSRTLSPNVEHRTRGWAGWLKRSKAFTLVARVDGEIVGFLAMHEIKSTRIDGKVGEVTAVFIHPNFWQKGIGQQLMQQLLADAQTHQFTTLTVWVLETNIPALKFYQSIGFQPDGKKRIFLENGENTLHEQRHQLRTSNASIDVTH